MRLALIVTALVGALICGTDAHAPIATAPPQGGRISGQVSDAGGQLIPGVSVIAMPASGGTISRATTGADGRYQIDGLTPATYRVDFELLGFDVFRRNRIVVAHGRMASADASLRISSICECVGYTPSVPVRPRSGVVSKGVAGVASARHTDGDSARRGKRTKRAGDRDSAARLSVRRRFIHPPGPLNP